MMDRGNLHLRAMHPQSQQGVCADFVAAIEGIDRHAVDELALMSQQRAAAAIKDARFKRSLVPVHNLDGSLALDYDEFPRPDTTLETLAGLKAVFGAWADMVVDEAGNTYGGLIRQKYRDLFEINEAFAVVTEKFIRDLKLDRAKVNVNGGAIALGHPIGASGSILVGTLLGELERQGKKRGLVTMCAAGGIAPALIIETV